MLFCRDSIQFRPLATAVRCEVMAPRTWHAGKRKMGSKVSDISGLVPLILAALQLQIPY